MNDIPSSSPNPKGFDSTPAHIQHFLPDKTSSKMRPVKLTESQNISPEIVDKILEGVPTDGFSISVHDAGVLLPTEVSHEKLEFMADQIFDAVESAAFLEKSGSEAVVSMRNYIEANGSEIISKLVNELQEDPTKLVAQSESIFKNTHATAEAFLSSLAFISREASSTLDYMRFQKNDVLFGADVLHGFKSVEVGTLLLKLLGAGGSAIVIQSLINQANKEIDRKRTLLLKATGDEKASLEREINILDNWAKLHHRTLLDQIKETVVSAVLAFPKIGFSICVILEKGSTMIGTAFFGLGIGVDMIGSSWEWYKTKKSVSKQKLWIQGFRNQGVDAKKLVEKQKKIFEGRMKKNLPLLKAKLQPVLEQLQNLEQLDSEEQEEVLRTSLLQLKEQGFELVSEERTLPSLEPVSEAQHELDKQRVQKVVPPMNLEKVTSPGELRELLLKPEVQHELNKQMVQKSEMLSGSLRNALKTSIIKKGEIERGFLKWDLLKLKISAAAVFINAGLWIAVKAALLPVMIGGTVTGLVISGYGMLALAVVLLVASLAYLYYKKPNIFKTMCKGVYVELALRKIPLAIQHYRRQSALLDTLTVAERSQVVTNNLLTLRKLEQIQDCKFEEIPEDLQKFIYKKLGQRNVFTSEDIKQCIPEYCLFLEGKLKHYEGKMQAVNERVLYLNESVQEHESKINGLQELISKAKWKDYQRLLHQDTGRAQKSQEDDIAVLASSLLSDEGLLQDPDIISILEQMEIDLGALRAAYPDDSAKEAVKALKSFFAMDDKELLHAIHTYKRKLKIASS
jgi:hypothetical protein